MDKLNRWLTLLTNLGVLVGLVVLVYEVNQNTQALQNETDVAIYSMAAVSSQLYFGSEELRRLVMDSRTKPWSEFSEADQMMLAFYWRNEVDRAELQYRLFKRNQADLDNIVFYEPYLQLRSFRGWWADAKAKGLYERGFVSYFDGLIRTATG